MELSHKNMGTNAEIQSPLTRKDHLKICLVLGLAKLTIKNSKKVKKVYEQECEQKRMGKTFSFFSRSLNLMIDPKPRKIQNLEECENFYNFLITICKRKIQKKKKTFFLKRNFGAAILLTSLNLSSSEKIKEEEKKVEPSKNKSSKKVDFKMNHQRFLSEFSEKQNEIKQFQKTKPFPISRKKKLTEYFNRKKTEEINFFKKTQIKFSSAGAQCNALTQMIKVVIKNMCIANHLVNGSGYRNEQQSQIVIYISELNLLYHILWKETGQILKFIGMPSAELQVKQKDLFEEYFKLSQLLGERLKQVLMMLSYYEMKMRKAKGQIQKLMDYLLLTRYYLLYLQKQIENKQIHNKTMNKKMSKWQKFYHKKFIGKSAR